MRNADSASPSPAFVGAFWAAFVGGLLLTFAIFVPLPDALVLAGALLFIGSVLAVFVLSVAAARNAHEGLLKSLARGVADAVRWLFDLMPA